MFGIAHMNGYRQANLAMPTREPEDLVTKLYGNVQNCRGLGG